MLGVCLDTFVALDAKCYGKLGFGVGSQTVFQGGNGNRVATVVAGLEINALWQLCKSGALNFLWHRIYKFELRFGWHRSCQGECGDDSDGQFVHFICMCFDCL